MSFSSALQLIDLNDYITPSQECIKPVEIKKDSQASKEIVLDSNGVYYEIAQDGTANQLEKAEITLNDCLACSGCITSAETVLITMQSHKELLKAIEQKQISDEKRLVVVSVSPQSRASFAAKYSLSITETHDKICHFLKSNLGVDYVFDTSFSRDLSLVASSEEFIRRYQASQNGKKQVLPMLSGICPGWICYAEKTHGYIIPYIDTTKSPQQIMGSLVKRYFAEIMDISPSLVYHVTVMPCYDKKLEATRDDFRDSDDVKDVDCVITTGELEVLFKEKGVDIREIEAFSSGYDLFVKADRDYGPLSSSGNSSGGYMNYILKQAALRIFNISLREEEIIQGSERIVISYGRNSDFKQTTLVSASGEPLLKFAQAYGFRNIQNFVRKLKGKGVRGSIKSKEVGSDYHFIEVMACPSGCINGGGQLRPSGDASWSSDVEPKFASKEWVQTAEKVYGSIENTQEPQENTLAMEIYQKWSSELSQKLLHTQYHAIEKKDLNGLNVKW